MDEISEKAILLNEFKLIPNMFFDEFIQNGTARHAAVITQNVEFVFEMRGTIELYQLVGITGILCVHNSSIYSHIKVSRDIDVIFCGSNFAEKSVVFARMKSA